MPAKPKKAKASKGAPKEKTEDVDPVNEAEEGERKRLAQDADRIFKQTVKEDHDFNSFQQQREKLNYFWIVEKKKVEDKKAELRNKERELQDLEERHQVEIKIYKQRVKHLLYEHQNEITTKKIEVEESLVMAQNDHRSGEAALKLDRGTLKRDLKEMELSHDNYLKSLKHAQDRNITLLRAEVERKTSEVHRNFEQRMKMVRERLEARRKAETAAIEERKNIHIEHLMKAHEKAFAEIKNYYNDITHNNLDLIKSLKEEVADMRRKEQLDEKLMYEVAQENKRMSEPLRRAKQDVERLCLEVEKHKVQCEELRQTKARLLVVEDKLRVLKWEEEVLAQRYSAVQSERDELSTRFQSSVCEVERRAGFRNLLLERKLSALAVESERREACLGEVLARANVDPSAARQLHGRLENALENKANIAADLMQELQGIRTAHIHLVEAANRKLKEFGVPIEELGYQPALPPHGAIQVA